MHVSNALYDVLPSAKRRTELVTVAHLSAAGVGVSLLFLRSGLHGVAGVYNAVKFLTRFNWI